MNGKVNRIILVVALVILIEASILMFNQSNNYDQNVIDITINEVPIHLYYKEAYRSVLIPYLLDSRNESSAFNIGLPPINEIEYDDNLEISIKEFSTYNQDNERVSLSGWNMNINKYQYKEEKINNCEMIVKRLDNVIYQNSCIKSLTEIVTEPGRYFFQVILKRNINFYTSVKTHMSFNVIIKEGLNNE